MNEEAIQQGYSIFKSEGYNGSIDDYKQLISTNGNALKQTYDIFKQEGYNEDINSFKTLMGIGSIKKKSQAENGGSTLGVGSSVSPKTDYSKYKKVGDKYYSGNGEFFDNYPGKEGKGYRFNDNQWYEYSSTILGDKEQIEKLDNPIKDPRRVLALNKQFNKTAGTEKGVFIGYPGKEQNEYKINNDGTWQRRTPENKTWVTVTNENSISALNNQFGQSAKKIEPEKISKIKEDNLYQSNFYANLKSINAQLIGGEEEEAVDVLRRKFPLFTFNEINAGDKIEITSPKGNKEQFTLDNWTWDKDKKISEEMIGWMEGNNLSPSEKKQYANVRRANAEEASFKYPNIGDTAAMKAMQEDMSLNLKKAINPNDVTAPSLESTQYALEKEKANKKAKELRADWMPIKSQKLNDIVNKYSEYTSYKGNVSEYEKTRAQAALGALASDKVEIGNVNKYQEDIKYNIDSYKSKLNDTSFFNNLQNKYDNGEITEDQYNLDYTNRQKELIDQEKEIKNQIKISDGLIKNVNKSVGENYLIQETKGSIGGGLVLGAIKGVLSPVRLLAGSTGRDMSAAEYHEAVKEAISPLWDFDTSLEYLRSEERSDLTKAAFSVAESLGAMAPMALSGGTTLLGTGLLARGAMTATAFYPMSYYEMKDELEEIDIPESDKVAMASIYGVVSSALESIGMEYALGKIDTAIGSSIKRNILKKVLGKSLSKDAPKEAIDALVRNETKSYIASLGLGTLGAMSVEGVTESLQSLTGAGIKEIYDTAKDTEFFSNEGFGDIVKGALYEGYLGALGGGMVHSIYIAKDAYKRNNVLKSKELNNLLMAAKTSGMSEALMSNLKADMLSNRITKEQAEEISNNFEIVRGMTNQMPENLTVEGQSASLSLMLEKNELNKQIEGKDPNLVKRQAARVNEINERLQEIGEKNTVENAIQEQTAGEVPVQPTTTVGEEVVQGEPTAEPQVLTEEGKAEEVSSFMEIEKSSIEDYLSSAKKNLEDATSEEDRSYYKKTIDEKKQELELFNSNPIEYAKSKLEEFSEKDENGELYTPFSYNMYKDIYDALSAEATTEGKAEEVELTPRQKVEAKLEANKKAVPVVEAPVVEATSKEKVATYRAEEQAELLKAIPKIESYKVNGEIDENLMPKTVLAKYNKIYEKYNALISPLLEKAETPVVETDKLNSEEKQYALESGIPEEDAIPTRSIFKKVISRTGITVERVKQLIKSNKYTEKKVKVDEISPSQLVVERDLISKIENKDNLPIIGQLGNEFIVLDGHHRISTYIRNGAKTINAKVIDLSAMQAKAPVVKAPVVKAQAPKAKGELPVMSWSNVDRYKDDVIRAMREIQNKLLTPLLALKYNTTAKQKKQIIDIRAKIALADKILKRNFARAKREQAKIEKEKNIKPTAKVEPTKAKVTSATTSVKALFESNPELANEVYEALGIKDNVVTKTKKKIDFDKLDKKWSDKILTILKEKYPEVSFEFTENTIQFIDDPMVFMQLSNKMYTEFKRLLTKKRPDLVDRGLIEKSLDDISAFSDEFGTKENKTKLEKLALHWMLNGAVILPEDGPKVVEAEKIANKKKLDAFSYSNPNEIIEKFAEESKKERVDPDTLSSFTNKKEIGDGIVIYDVENSDKGQEQARIVLDTHFGEKSNPWCLLYKDADGSLTRAKEHWFKTYRGPKKIAFQNGKLIAFYGGNLWWDRLDNSSEGIPIVRKIKDDNLKRKQLIVVDSNDANKIISYGNKTLGNEQNGEYKEWNSYDDLISEANFKDGEQDGKSIIYYRNGQIEMESNFKDGLANGKTILYYRNGQIQMESNFKDGEQDGKEIRYYKNGQIQYDENYKDGRVDGNGIGYYENGKLRFEANYKDGKRIDYYENGQIQYETDFKNGEVDGKRMSYYDNGQIQSEENFKSDRLDGYQIQYRDNRNRFNLAFDLSQIEYRRLWKDGKLVSEVNYQKNKENEIIGQANTEAMTVLVNALKQKKDTIPHEYAHIYIAMFRDTPIVQEGIKRFGSEEKLVQAIGEQVVQQKGEAYNWWKKFTNFILKIMSDQQVVQVLTDSFLERADLTTYNYTKYSKTQAQNLFSDYIKQNPSGDIDGFREFVFEKQTKPVVKAEAKAPVKEEAKTPAKESTAEEGGILNDIEKIQEDINSINEDIEKARTEARNKVNAIDLPKIETKLKSTLEDLNDKIADIEIALEEVLDPLQIELLEKVTELDQKVKSLKNTENENTLLDYLKKARESLIKLDKLTYVKLDLGISLKTAQLVLDGLIKIVETATNLKKKITLKQAINEMYDKYKDIHPNVSKKRFIQDVNDFLDNTFVEQKTNKENLQDTQDKLVEFETAVRLIAASKLIEAERVVRKMLKGKVRKLTPVQVKSIMRRLVNFNVFSQTQYDKFIDYVDKVIGIADYDAKVTKANKDRKFAKKNMIKLGDISSDLLVPLSRVLNINAKLIPKDVFESYSEIIEMLSKRAEVLKLNERSNLNESIDKIIESIESNEQRISDLKELYDNFEKVKSKTNEEVYSKTLDKMLKEGVIDKAEHELMKTFKLKILEEKGKVKKMTEQQVADEKVELIKEVKKTTITLDEIVGDEFRLERELVKRLQIILKQTDFQNLNNKELKDLLRIIDNINNGFVSNATQQMVEKLNKIKNGVLLAAAIPKSLKGFFRKAANVRRKLTKDIFGKTIQRDEFGLDAFSASSMDEQLNNFKSTPIFDITREQNAIQIEKFKAKMTEIISELARAENEIASWDSFKRSGNLMQLSKFKMSIYMMQLEKDSNPNSNQVHQAMDTLNKTIDFANENKGISTYSDLDIKQMEFIKDNFQKDGEIDIDKLYKSFNKQEKDALEIFKKINSEMTKFATYTATVINGKKIEPINNYFFYNTINENKTSAQQITARINNINDNMNPTTVSKNLEERDGNVHAVQLNPFNAVNISARSVLLNYYMTEAIRTTKKTFSEARKIIKENKDEGIDVGKQFDILSVLENSYDTAFSDLVESYINESQAFFDFIKKTSYRAMLGSIPRSIGEYLSNAYGAWVKYPKDMMEGRNLKKTIDKDLLVNLGSKLTSRLFAADNINSSGQIDLSNITNRITKNGKTRTKIVNGVTQVWDYTAVKWVDFVGTIADELIAKPDQKVLRPLWGGSFSRAFKKETGVDFNENKIKANDEEYMDKYRDALAKATKIADKNVNTLGGNMNSFMGVLQNAVRNDDNFLQATTKNFQQFMGKFIRQDYDSARKGLNALVGNGTISKTDGGILLAVILSRQVLYTYLVKSFIELFAILAAPTVEFVFSLLGFEDDDDDDKTISENIDEYLAKGFTGELQKLYRTSLSAITTVLLGGNSGNALRVAENYFIEKANKKYGEKIGLRDGEYDPYKDAIQFNQFQDIGSKDEALVKIGKVLLPVYSPLIGVTEVALKLALSPEPEGDRARLTRAKEYVRLGLEAAGNAGVMPFYKDIRKVAQEEVYKELKKETKETAVKKEAQAKTDAEEIVQKTSILKQMMNSGAYTREGIKKELRKIKDPEYRKAEKKIEDDMLKSILDKTKYSSRTDFEKREKENAKNAFKMYDKKREESLKINRELTNRMDALEYGEQYVPKKKKSSGTFGGGDSFGGSSSFGGSDSFGGGDSFGGSDSFGGGN